MFENLIKEKCLYLFHLFNDVTVVGVVTKIHHEGMVEVIWDIKRYPYYINLNNVPGFKRISKAQAKLMESASKDLLALVEEDTL